MTTPTSCGSLIDFVKSTRLSTFPVMLLQQVCIFSCIYCAHDEVLLNYFLVDTTLIFSQVLHLLCSVLTFHYLCLIHFYLQPFGFHSLFLEHNWEFSINFSSESAINAKSSAYRSSLGNPSRNALDNASSKVINNNRLKTDRWCTPTCTSNSLLSLPLTFRSHCTKLQ